MRTKQTIRNFVRRAAVTLLLAVLTTAAAWAQTVYTVTLTAGDGSGSDVTLNSTDNYYGESDNGGGVPNGQFLTMDSQLWFKIPDCPGSFTAPSGKVFTGWDLNGDDWTPGNYLQISGDVTLTAQWAEAGNAKLLSLTPSQGTLDPQFDPDNTGYDLKVSYNGTPVSVTVQVVAQDPNATVEYNLDDGSPWQNTCPPMTAEDYNLNIKVTNGANEETYWVTLNIIYTLTLTTEGEGTAKAYYGNVEGYTGANEERLFLEATPAAGWTFKEWQLVSGDGTLSNATSQNNGQYRFNRSNAEVKAVFEPSITLATEGYGTYYNGTHDVTLPSGMKAYIVTAKTSGGTTGTLTYEEIADGDGDGTTVKKTVPSGVAVMLKADASGNPWNLAMSATDIDNRTFGANLLHGSDAAATTTGGDVYYKLSYDTDGTNLGWYWGADGGAAFESGAHKAWLAVPSSAGARGYFGLPGDGGTTGIRPPLTPPTQEGNGCAWYSLDGRRLVGKPSAKGVYIHNGRKEVIR